MTSLATDVRGTNTTHFEPQNHLSTGNPLGASADTTAAIGALERLPPFPFGLHFTVGAEAGNFSTTETRQWTAAPPNAWNLPERADQIRLVPALGTSTQDCPRFTNLGPSEVQRARFPERIFRFEPVSDQDPLDITPRLAEFKELQDGGADKWLAAYVDRQRQAEKAMATIRQLQTRYGTGGRKFTREEMNER